MRKYRRALCLPVLFFLCTNISAQNLVPNPSFEEYTECPDSGYITYATHWVNPSLSGVAYPEYYNECSENVYYSIPARPNNDFQQTHSGSAYAGISPFNGPGINNREYIRTQLISPLLIGRLYYVEFFVNQINNFDYSINNLSLSFTQSPNNSVVIGNVLDQPSHVFSFGNPIINDTSTWLKICGIYHSTGNEAFLTIGNFSDDANTEILATGNSNYQGAYYFVDDVAVEEIFSPFWEYRDTSVYYGDSVLIGPAITGLDIDWFTSNMEFITNSPGVYVKPATSRNYIAKETFNGTETTHIVHVTVIGGAGIEENELVQMVVYPNPTKDEFFISGVTTHEPMEILVGDVNGKIVSEWKKDLANGLNVFTLNVDNGIYFVNVINPITNESSVEKLVIHK